MSWLRDLFLGIEHTEEHAKAAERRYERRASGREVKAGGARKRLAMECAKPHPFLGWTSEQVNALGKAADAERKSAE